jgi:mono/diheme cytochrome c family protein
MNVRFLPLLLLGCAVALTATGCNDAPGKPKLASEYERPDRVFDFATLYKQNCAACHGESGRNGAAISLANPVYIATAGVANISRVTSAGVAGTMMPAFGIKAGGTLTDRQVQVIAQGIADTWGQASALGGQAAVAYASSAQADPANGQKAFSASCARCHGADGTGLTTDKGRVGSLVDPAYLALISDQGLRSIIIAGQPEQGMPDWRSDLTGANARPLTEQEITDIVAWLASHRTSTPGQPYQQHP